MLPQFNILPHESFLNQQVGTTQDISFAQDGGVMKTLVAEGIGEERPFFGDTIEVAYIGYTGEIADENIFDSSERDGELFTFLLGKGNACSSYLKTIVWASKSISMKSLSHNSCFHTFPFYCPVESEILGF